MLLCARAVPVGIIKMDSIVCQTVKTLNPFIQKWAVAVQADGTVIAIGVWLILQAPSRLWLRKETVAPADGIRIASTVSVIDKITAQRLSIRILQSTQNEE